MPAQKPDRALEPEERSDRERRSPPPPLSGTDGM
jgi:hypothetical protein